MKESSFYGPIAQLGERSVRIREVEGSNPFGSTSGKLPLPRRAPHFCGVRCFLCPRFQHSFFFSRTEPGRNWPSRLRFFFCLAARVYSRYLFVNASQAASCRSPFAHLTLWGARFFLPAFTAGVSFVTPAKPQRNSRSGHGLSAAPPVFSPCRKGPGKAKGASGASRAGSPPSPFCQPIPFSRFSSKPRFRAAAPSWGSRWNGARHRPTSYPSMATAALITVPEPPY